MTAKRHYRAWTDQDLTKAVANNFSISTVLKALNLRPSGGNYLNIKLNIQRLNLSCQHFKGTSWNRGLRSDTHKLKNIPTVKRTLLEQRGRRCEKCLLTEWQNQPIPIEIHHVDGNRCNNADENLQLLCSNCHAQTPNFRNKKQCP